MSDKQVSTHTPWGGADYQKNYAPGVDWYATPSHGGFRVERDLYEKVCKEAGIPVGTGQVFGNDKYLWFEEDVDWSFVAIAFPKLFDENDLARAENFIRHTYPDYWEQWQGRDLVEGESQAKDEIMFYMAHKDDWLGVSTVLLSDGTDTLVVTAALGGDPQTSPYRRYIEPVKASPNRLFLVSSEKYDKKCYPYDDRFRPYLVDEHDQEISKAELDELKAHLRNTITNNMDEFLPISVSEDDENPNNLTLVCKRSSTGFYLDGIDKISVPVSREEWEKRDLKAIYCARKDGEEWKLQKLEESPANEENDDDGPQP